MLSEIFTQILNAKTRQEKVLLLRKHQSPAMMEILKYGVSPSVHFYTKTIPPYKEDFSPAGLSFSSLYNEYKKLYMFLSPDQEQKMVGSITQIGRKNQLLVQMLESIHPSEGQLLISLLKGEFTSKTGIDMALVSEAFGKR